MRNATYTGAWEEVPSTYDGEKLKGVDGLYYKVPPYNISNLSSKKTPAPIAYQKRIISNDDKSSFTAQHYLDRPVSELREELELAEADDADDAESVDSEFSIVSLLFEGHTYYRNEHNDDVYYDAEDGELVGKFVDGKIVFYKEGGNF